MPMLAVLFLVFCATASAVAAQARVDSICAGTEALTRAQIQARTAQAVEDPRGARVALSRLSRELHENLAIFPHPALVRVDRRLSRSIAELRAATDPAQAAPFDLPRLVYATLARSRDDLDQIAAVFGCNPPPPDGALSEVQPGNGAFALTERLWSVILGQPLVLRDFAVIFAILGALGAGALLFKRSRRENVRHPCRIPLHVVYGDDCTVTTILDIALGGMKIEAAAAETGQNWVLFHFAGHKLEGRIVWRNRYYAGVKFRKPLTEQALAEILEQNLRPLRDAGIEKISTACFQPGCHLACDRHLPTAIAAKAAHSGRART